MPTSLGCYAHQSEKTCKKSQQRGAVVEQSYFTCAHKQGYHEIFFFLGDRKDFKGILMREKNTISPLNR